MDLGDYPTCISDPKKNYSLFIYKTVYTTMHMGICLENGCNAEALDNLKS